MELHDISITSTRARASPLMGGVYALTDGNLAATRLVTNQNGKRYLGSCKIKPRYKEVGDD